MLRNVALGGALLGMAATGCIAEEEPRVAASLPDSPGFVSSTSAVASSSSLSEDGLEESAIAQGPRAGSMVGQKASMHALMVADGLQAPKLDIGSKVLLGVYSSVKPTSMIGWVLAAGYEQAVNGSPNYGQTAKGFAQRLGAAAARSSSDDIFSISVLAPILHEDPRYYQLGSGHSVLKRVVYAATRPLITRTDSGATTPNFSLIGGNLAGAAVTQWYYPPTNTGVQETMKTFGGSLGGSAVRFILYEFLGDSLQRVIHRTDAP